MSEYRDEMAYHVFGMEWEWHQAFNYQPRKSTLLDHLNDCFGWLV